MNEQYQIWTCSACGARQDISQLGFFVEIACPHCGRREFVHTQLANYRIDSVLGIGGMSMVFQATDLVLERALAIKVLHDAYRNEPERIAGFENECSLMAKVRHENVVSVYSAGWSRGQFYIAMELVEGRNLELIVADRGFLLPADALEIVRQVALGLQAAHEAGLLHRDVKPGNVIITTDGMAKVLDFGLSLEDTHDADTGGVIWATPYYAPPETLQREPESVQTDIYALGMTLRNLLTGEASLPGSPQTVGDMLEAKKNLPPIASLLPHPEPELCALVEHMTAFEVHERPSGYEELLEEVAQAQAAMAAVLNPEERERRYRRKLYATAGILGSMMLGLIGGFLVALVTPSETLQDVLDTEALRWVETSSYSEALEQLRDGHYEQSAAIMAALGERSYDPAVAAAATFIRTAFNVLDDKNPDNGYRRFDELVADAEDRVSPAGEESLEKICGLASALRRDLPASEEQIAALDDSLLKVAALILLADQHVKNGQHARATNTISGAMDILPACQAESLRELLDEYRMAAPRRAARVALGQLRGYYAAGELKRGDAVATELLKQKLSRLEKEEIKVLLEVSSIMQVARDTMQRGGVNSLPADASPEEYHQAVATWKNAGSFPEELASLVCLLKGDYDKAFRHVGSWSPNVQPLPFQVMLLDWKKRLEK